ALCIDDVGVGVRNISGYCTGDEEIASIERRLALDLDRVSKVDVQLIVGARLREITRDMQAGTYDVNIALIVDISAYRVGIKRSEWRDGYSRRKGRPRKGSLLNLRKPRIGRRLGNRK